MGRKSMVSTPMVQNMIMEPNMIKELSRLVVPNSQHCMEIQPCMHTSQPVGQQHRLCLEVLPAMSRPMERQSNYLALRQPLPKCMRIPTVYRKTKIN